MFFDVFKFELKYHASQRLFYVLAGVFFLLVFAATTTPNVQIAGGLSNININAPYAIVANLTSLSVFVLFGGIAFCGNAVIRDHDLKTAELFMSMPIGKFDYVYGRFAGALVFVAGMFLAGLLGAFMGEFMWWQDPHRIGPTSLQAYWFVTWAIALPNLFVLSCIFFCVSTTTRSMMATYIGMVVLLMLSFLLDSFTDKDTVALTSILDPFGSTALEQLTRYWTVYQKNNQVPALAGALLANRALWMGIGVLFLAAAYPLTSFSLQRGRKAKKAADDEMPPVAPLVIHPVTVHQSFGAKAQALQFLSQARLEARNIVFSVPFIVLLLLGLFLVIANAIGNLGNIYGTPVYPTTAVMVDIVNGAFSLSLLAVLIYYAGELMARERATHVSELIDAMPWPNWIMLAAKLAGLSLVIVSMLLTAMVAAIGVQLYKGFYDIDIMQYLEGLLFFFQFPLYLMMVLALFSYIVTRSKYGAMFLMVLYVVYTLVMPQAGFEDYLYRLRELAPVYSDFTGYGQRLEAYLWQTAYYAFFGGLLIIAMHLLWPRGIEDTWAARLRSMRQRMTLPVVVGLWSLSTLFVITGGYIYYNTHILNDYQTRKQSELQQADYEKRYKQYENMLQPDITDVYADVDIYPGRREVRVRGHYTLVNDAGVPLEQVHISRNPGPKLRSMTLASATLEKDDEDLGYRIYKFDKPLQPGEQIRLDFDIDWDSPGFANNGHSLKITSNGTFFNNLDVFPLIGYRSDFELKDNNKRNKYGLPKLERMAKIDDKSAWYRVGLSSTRRTRFETVVSTSADQIALAPGYLQKEWVNNGRHYYHYKMDQPIWNFFAYVSARYKVKKAMWHDDVSIEVYYLHGYNVDRMIAAAKHGLDYYTRHFSPYQYRQYRILEFPRFQGSFAQSFPNTIPFSESIGFVADLRDPTQIDYVTYVTAHELAHQWWAHQVLGADVQGSTMIVESLAQYSALMVMEHLYGADHMKRFLQYELDRYLQGRGGEQIKELPLYLVEDQPYIHYRKGSVVLYALKDYIGEANMDRALSNFLADYAFKGPPYPTTKDLIKAIREQAPAKYQAVITDLLQKIVLYDLRVVDSSVKPVAGGKYEVTVDVSAKKLEAGEGGAESVVPMDAWIDIGVLGDEQGEARVPEILYLRKHHITGEKQQFTIVVDKKPVSVGIDPLNKLIDRDPSDNVEKIEHVEDGDEGEKLGDAGKKVTSPHLPS